MDLKKTKISPKLCVKQQLLYNNLKQFYKNEERLALLTDILNGRSKLSLRIIDWFVTNYTKKTTIMLYRNIDRLVLCDEPGTVDSNKTKKNKYKSVKSSEQFNVYLKYKGQLKAYSKKHFDPFCRRNRINFYYNDEECLVTTIGQLNFFRWAIDYNILDYIRQNLDIIETDMNKNIKRENETDIKKSKKKATPDIAGTKEKKKRLRKKRRELSCAATNTLNKQKFSITLEFE